MRWRGSDHLLARPADGLACAQVGALPDGNGDLVGILSGRVVEVVLYRVRWSIHPSARRTSVTAKPVRGRRIAGEFAGPIDIGSEARRPDLKGSGARCSASMPGGLSPGRGW